MRWLLRRKLAQPVRHSLPIATDDTVGLHWLTTDEGGSAAWAECFPYVFLRNERTGENIVVRVVAVDVDRGMGSHERQDFEPGDTLLRVAEQR